MNRNFISLFSILSAPRRMQSDVAERLLPTIALGDPQQAAVFAAVSVPEQIRTEERRQDAIADQAITAIETQANPQNLSALKNVIDRNPAVGQRIEQARINLDTKAYRQAAQIGEEIIAVTGLSRKLDENDLEIQKRPRLIAAIKAQPSLLTSINAVAEENKKLGEEVMNLAFTILSTVGKTGSSITFTEKDLEGYPNLQKALESAGHKGDWVLNPTTSVAGGVSKSTTPSSP